MQVSTEINAPAPNCASKLEEWGNCSAHCGNAGIVQSGEQGVQRGTTTTPVLYEVMYHGCTACVAAPGAPVRAVCNSPKVCAGACFACNSGPSSVSLRACVDGHCADALELKRLMGELGLLVPCTR